MKQSESPNHPLTCDSIVVGVQPLGDGSDYVRGKSGRGGGSIVVFFFRVTLDSGTTPRGARHITTRTCLGGGEKRKKKRGGGGGKDVTRAWVGEKAAA